jgi:hypothetical protein
MYRPFRAGGAAVPENSAFNSLFSIASRIALTRAASGASYSSRLAIIARWYAASAGSGSLRANRSAFGATFCVMSHARSTRKSRCYSILRTLAALRSSAINMKPESVRKRQQCSMKGASSTK